MKKLICCFSIVCAGLFASCVDKNELVDEDEKPEWLGGTIYSELKGGGSGKLTGTFNYYLRLVDDLGYGEVLGRTGSMTVFPANDEAFEKFFSSGEWGVHSYEELTVPQKKLLLNSSMINNAMLVDMLSGISNVNSSSGVSKGQAIKHTTRLETTDSITWYPMASALSTYGGNSYWTRFASKGIFVVKDASTPMMVHFTRDYMLNKSITTDGDNSDFSILMGQPYEDGAAYIFRNKIVNRDVTCQNGYIHQMENVIVPPGNMAQVLESTSYTSIFSHILNRFAVPVYNASVTTNYQDWYKGQKEVGNDLTDYYDIDSIFEVKYMSEVSSNGSFKPSSNEGSGEVSQLPYDPGWNGYGLSSTDLTTIGAMFVPTDAAMTSYFVYGAGKSIIDRYAGEENNTEDKVMENVDKIPLATLQPLVKNLMKTNLAEAVPSKFATIPDDAADFMDLSIDSLAMKDGAYDVKIANNGVIYILKSVIGPKKYMAVSAPTLFQEDLLLMQTLINNQTLTSGGSLNSYSLNLDYYAYLLAMTSNFALFLPTDDAFSEWYVNPATLGTDNEGRYSQTPKALRFKYAEKDPFIEAYTADYDPTTGTVDESTVQTLNLSTNWAMLRSIFVDMLQYNTIVLNSGETLGTNNYYQTKHGGEVKVSVKGSGDDISGTVASGGQIDGGCPVSNIIKDFDQENGHAYKLDHLIQGPFESVYSVLKNNPNFSEFLSVCEILGDEEMLEAAELKDQADSYTILYRPGADESSPKFRCLDYNVKLFNQYNYTVYVPDNAAMEIAYQNDLPNPTQLKFEQESGASPADLKANLEALRKFVRYHFQTTSIYADNHVNGGNYTTFLSDANSISTTLGVSGGNGSFTVEDASGTKHTISANGSLLSNKMTRDLELNDDKDVATYVQGRSFAVVHELSEPLYYNKAKNFGLNAKVAAVKRHN